MRSYYYNKGNKFSLSFHYPVGEPNTITKTISDKKEILMMY